MLCAQADLRLEQRHKRRSNDRRNSSRSSSPDDREKSFRGSSRLADRDRSRGRYEQAQEPFDAEAYLEATTFGPAGGLARGEQHGYRLLTNESKRPCHGALCQLTSCFCSRSRSRSREREGSYSRTRERSRDRDWDRNRARQRAHDHGGGSHQDRQRGHGR
jgi:hypothetical protein